MTASSIADQANRFKVAKSNLFWAIVLILLVGLAVLALWEMEMFRPVHDSVVLFLVVPGCGFGLALVVLLRLRERLFSWKDVLPLLRTLFQMDDRILKALAMAGLAVPGGFATLSAALALNALVGRQSRSQEAYAVVRLAKAPVVLVARSDRSGSTAPLDIGRSYRLAAPGDTVVLTTRSGFLGYRWVEKCEVVRPSWRSR